MLHKTIYLRFRRSPLALLFVGVLATASLAGYQVSAEDQIATNQAELAPIPLKLPAAKFEGTRKDIQFGASVEPLSKKPRPPFMAPKGVKNVALGKKVTSSDANADAATLAKITDGNKEVADNSIALLRKGQQYVQIDLGGTFEVFAIVIWHAHDAAKVYHDVVVQSADDADFIDNVQTLFNNDQDNSAGLGVGTNREYFETNEGKLIDAKGAKIRFLRFYSKGSTDSSMNEYTEIEVYGK